MKYFCSSGLFWESSVGLNCLLIFFYFFEILELGDRMLGEKLDQMNLLLGRFNYRMYYVLEDKPNLTEFEQRIELNTRSVG